MVTICRVAGQVRGAATSDQRRQGHQQHRRPVRHRLHGERPAPDLRHDLHASRLRYPSKTTVFRRSRAVRTISPTSTTTRPASASQRTAGTYVPTATATNAQQLVKA